MIAAGKDTISVSNRADLARARMRLLQLSKEIGMSVMRETALRTAATELLSNMIRYGGGGRMIVEQLEHEGLRGIRATFEDEGPGIKDVEAALSKGFSTGKSLGHGLFGCRNLVDSFDLQTTLGKGTRVVITQWC
jgi:serine/threonine-protein kinase RsbT